MGKEIVLGEMNGHAVGIVLRELVRRATAVIRNERQVFEVTKKTSYAGVSEGDMLTSADRKAQEIYLKSLRECFPGIGVIAEEDSLFIKPTDALGTYFTVDPLDGTKAYVRRQSHGVGTMIALVQGMEILSAYIGDVNTQEIYGYRPGSSRVHRITAVNVSEELKHNHNTPLTEQYVLLRDPERVYSPLSQRTILKSFKNVVVDGGSIGVWLARLWKGEVGGAILPPSWETPWDSMPIIGISKKLGYQFFRPSDEGTEWLSFDPSPFQEKYKREHETLIVHPGDMFALQ